MAVSRSWGFFVWPGATLRVGASRQHSECCFGRLGLLTSLDPRLKTLPPPQHDAHFPPLFGSNFAAKSTVQHRALFYTSEFLAKVVTEGRSISLPFGRGGSGFVPGGVATSKRSARDREALIRGTWGWCRLSLAAPKALK